MAANYSSCCGGLKQLPHLHAENCPTRAKDYAGPVLFREDAQERGQFNYGAKLYDGDALQAVASALDTWGRMRGGGSFEQQCYIMANECLKASALLAGPIYRSALRVGDEWFVSEGVLGPIEDAFLFQNNVDALRLASLLDLRGATHETITIIAGKRAWEPTPLLPLGWVELSSSDDFHYKNGQKVLGKDEDGEVYIMWWEDRTDHNGSVDTVTYRPGWVTGDRDNSGGISTHGRYLISDPKFVRDIPL